MKIVSERLRYLREGVKLSQAKLAKLMGTTQASVNRYESDTSSPSPETFLWYAVDGLTRTRGHRAAPATA